MKKEPHVSLLELAISLSKAADLVSPAVVNHHQQVAYISLRLGMEVGLPPENTSNLLIAGALHDIGALSLKERIDALNFEVEDPQGHAETGYYLLNLFKPFAGSAQLIRYHHIPWNYGEGAWFNNYEVPVESHILHLADRVAVLIHPQKDILSQVSDICSRIENQAGRMFKPDLVNALLNLSDKESFWLDCVSESIGTILGGLIKVKTVEFNLDRILDFAKIFSVIVDFRCPYTANHSSGVGVCAERLASLAGFSQHDSKMMKVAGYLHDLGKLAVPVGILNKPSQLTKEEFLIVKRHAYYTYRILEPINGFEVINSWASLHHECLNGSGYPFHLNDGDLSLGSRIMKVADVFTALTEDRPYRAGMDKENVLKIIHQMADEKAVDAGVVSLLDLHYDEINQCRLAAQYVTREEYKLLKPSTFLACN